jgi:hypothetical protein
MPRTFEIPVSPGGPTILRFPARCLACAGPAETTSTLAVSRLVARGPRRERQAAVQVRYEIPHCRTCARRTQAVFLAGLVPFLLGLLVAGGAAFVAVTVGAWRLGLDEAGKPGNANSLVLGACAGLVAGVAGGFVFEILGRLVLWPVLGSGFLVAPLLVVQLFTEGDHVEGARLHVDRDATRGWLTVSNDDVAAEIAELNREAFPAGPAS